MKSDAESRPARVAAASGPRFDLRFEAGAGELRLRAPYESAAMGFDELALDLGRMRFPVDVSRGPSAFRDHATRLRRLAVRFDTRALVRLASERGVDVRHLSGGPEVFALGVHDAFGTIACEAHAFFEASDLGLVVSRVRSVRDGPVSSFERLARALERLGFALDPHRGFFRLARPLRALLRAALVPLGYRIPDERGLDVGLGRGSGRNLVLEVPGAPADVFDRLETARALAPACALLASSHTSVALELLEPLARSSSAAVRQAAIDLFAMTLAEMRGHHRDLSSNASEAVRLCLAARAATSGDEVALADALEALTRAERVASVAVEALTNAIEHVGPKSAARMLELIEKAVRRSPHDDVLLASYASLAERASAPAAVLDAAERALDAPIATDRKIMLVTAAVKALDRMERTEDAFELVRRALTRAPESAELLELLADFRARAGDRERAVLDLDHAVELERSAGRLDRAAVLGWRAAEILGALGRDDSAAERLERALAHDPTRADIALSLARVRRAAGAVRAASQAYARLLDENVSAASDEQALIEAALFHLDDLGEPERAAEFVERLVRDDPDDPRLPDLLERVGLLQEVESLDGVFESEGEDAGEEGPITQIRVLEDADEVLRSVVLDSDPRGRTPAFEHRAEDDPAALRALAAVLRSQGKAGDAALALARAGVLEGDAATLRAAYRMAQQAGAVSAARRVVELALDAVGDGPAREGWLSLLNDLES